MELIFFLTLATPVLLSAHFLAILLRQLATATRED
jgi:hypothetical protein